MEIVISAVADVPADVRTDKRVGDDIKLASNRPTPNKYRNLTTPVVGI